MGTMYAKIFTQIFDSSIAENYKIRHVFEDMLKLADKDGVVDMTVEAIARRTNVPLEEVQFGIEELMKSDPESRSKESDGRRLLPLDSGRNWGWIIVNYAHYRAIQDEEARKQYFRDAKRKQREGKPRRRKKVETANPYGLTQTEKVQQAAEMNGDTGTAQRCKELADGVPPGTYSDNETPF